MFCHDDEINDICGLFDALLNIHGATFSSSEGMINIQVVDTHSNKERSIYSHLKAVAEDAEWEEI